MKIDKEIDLRELYILSELGVHLWPEWKTHWCKSKINPETEKAGREDLGKKPKIT